MLISRIVCVCVCVCVQLYVATVVNELEQILFHEMKQVANIIYFIYLFVHNIFIQDYQSVSHIRVFLFIEWLFISHPPPLTGGAVQKDGAEIKTRVVTARAYYVLEGGIFNVPCF